MKTYHALEFEDTFEPARRGARKVRFADIPQTNWRLPMKNQTRERSADEVIHAVLNSPERGRPESPKRRV
jgi:hypothetical protein